MKFKEKVMEKITYKVIKIDKIIENWLKLGIYTKRIEKWDKEKQVYHSKFLECDKCNKTEYHKDDLLYLNIWKNEGYCLDCFLKLKGDKIEYKRDKDKRSRKTRKS